MHGELPKTSNATKKQKIASKVLSVEKDTISPIFARVYMILSDKPVPTVR